MGICRYWGFSFPDKLSVNFLGRVTNKVKKSKVISDKKGGRGVTKVVSLTNKVKKREKYNTIS